MTTSAVQATATDSNKSSFKSAAWKEQQEAWTIVNDLWRDSLYIRRRGRTYLDQYKKEPNEKYDYRKQNSVFINEFRSCIERMAGIVFRSNPVPDEADKALVAMFTDIDLLGNSLHSFCIEAFEKYLRDGNVYIHVDAPAKPAGRSTKRDRLGQRPFLKMYTAAQAINHRYESVNGRETLTQITFEQAFTVPDGTFGEKRRIRHLVLKIGSWEIFESDEDKDEFTSTGRGETGLTFLPIISVADIGSVPPLITLALLNVLYYNKTSDFDDWCHVACVPEKIYQYATQQDADAAQQKVAVASPGVARMIWGEGAKVYFAEVSGDGMEIAKQRFEDIEGQMAKIGVNLFSPSSVAPRSATEVMDNAGQRQSLVAKYTREFENAIEQVIFMMGEVMNSIIPNTVNLSEQEVSKLKLKIDYDRLTFSVEQVRLYSDLVDSGKMSLETFLEFLANLVELPSKFSVQSELDRIAKQGAITTEDDLP